MTNKTNSPTQYVNKEHHLMVRTDKTLKQLMEEKPSSRWDSKYWHPKYEIILNEISTDFDFLPLGNYIQFITYGQVGERVYDDTGEVFYIQTKNLLDTGIDYYEKYAKIAINSHNDPKRSRLKSGDLLIANAGMGAVGKVTVFLFDDLANISQDIDLLRLDNIDPIYVALFLKTRYGNSQLWRRTRGVGAPKLPFDEIKYIKIPIIPDQIVSDLKERYREVHRLHSLYVKSRINGAANMNAIKQSHDRLIEIVKYLEEYLRRPKNA